MYRFHVKGLEDYGLCRLIKINHTSYVNMRYKTHVNKYPMRENRCLKDTFIIFFSMIIYVFNFNFFGGYFDFIITISITWD